MIKVLHPGLYPYDEPIMLHDLLRDPYQAENVAVENPDIVEELLVEMGDWRQEQIRSGGGPDPLEAMVSQGPFLYYTPERMFERLRKTGREDLVEGLRSRLGRYHRGGYA
jgi:hypothetical protein